MTVSEIRDEVPITIPITFSAATAVGCAQEKLRADLHSHDTAGWSRSFGVRVQT